MGNTHCFGREGVDQGILQAGTLEPLRGLANKDCQEDEDGFLVTQTQVTGLVVDMDSSDPTLTYKLKFADGSSDWFREDQVQLVGVPFSVNLTASTGSISIKGLLVSDPLSLLAARVAEELRQPLKKILLSLEDNIFRANDMKRCLGVLGLGEGSSVSCLVNDFDESLVRIENATDKDYAGDGGELEHWKLAVLIYGRKGSSAQRVLWAEHARQTSDARMLELPGCSSRLRCLDAQISDGVLLQVSQSDGKSITHPISKLIAEASEKELVDLQDQLHKRFGEHGDWPRILGRLCRKIN